jgi:siroheme synthase
MHRKRFLLLAGAVLSATAGRWLFLESSTPAGPPLRPSFLTQLFDDSEILRLGDLYRARVPAEDSVHALMRQLLNDREVARLRPGDPALARRLAEQVRTDFQHERVVLLDGWVLSLTEARQCALVAILSG